MHDGALNSLICLLYLHRIQLPVNNLKQRVKVIVKVEAILSWFFFNTFGTKNPIFTLSFPLLKGFPKIFCLSLPQLSRDKVSY